MWLAEESRLAVRQEALVGVEGTWLAEESRLGGSQEGRDGVA